VASKRAADEAAPKLARTTSQVHGLWPRRCKLLELEEEAETAWSVGSRPESSRPRRSSVITRLHSPELLSSESNRGDGSLDRLWQRSSCHT